MAPTWLPKIVSDAFSITAMKRRLLNRLLPFLKQSTQEHDLTMDLIDGNLSLQDIQLNLKDMISISMLSSKIDISQLSVSINWTRALGFLNEQGMATIMEQDLLDSQGGEEIEHALTIEVAGVKGSIALDINDLNDQSNSASTDDDWGRRMVKDMKMTLAQVELDVDGLLNILIEKVFIDRGVIEINGLSINYKHKQTANQENEELKPFLGFIGRILIKLGERQDDDNKKNRNAWTAILTEANDEIIFTIHDSLITHYAQLIEKLKNVSYEGHASYNIDTRIPRLCINYPEQDLFFDANQVKIYKQCFKSDSFIFSIKSWLNINSIPSGSFEFMIERNNLKLSPLSISFKGSLNFMQKEITDDHSKLMKFLANTEYSLGIPMVELSLHSTHRILFKNVRLRINERKINLMQIGLIDVDQGQIAFHEITANLHNRSIKSPVILNRGLFFPSGYLPFDACRVLLEDRQFLRCPKEQTSKTLFTKLGEHCIYKMNLCIKCIEGEDFKKSFVTEGSWDKELMAYAMRLRDYLQFSILLELKIQQINFAFLSGHSLGLQTFLDFDQDKPLLITDFRFSLNHFALVKVTKIEFDCKAMLVSRRNIALTGIWRGEKNLTLTTRLDGLLFDFGKVSNWLLFEESYSSNVTIDFFKSLIKFDKWHLELRRCGTGVSMVLDNNQDDPCHFIFYADRTRITYPLTTVSQLTCYYNECINNVEQKTWTPLPPYSNAHTRFGDSGFRKLALVESFFLRRFQLIDSANVDIVLDQGVIQNLLLPLLQEEQMSDSCESSIVSIPDTMTSIDELTRTEMLCPSMNLDDIAAIEEGHIRSPCPIPSIHRDFLEEQAAVKPDALNSEDFIPIPVNALLAFCQCRFNLIIGECVKVSLLSTYGHIVKDNQGAIDTVIKVHDIEGKDINNPLLSKWLLFLSRSEIDSMCPTLVIKVHLYPGEDEAHKEFNTFSLTMRPLRLKLDQGLLNRLLMNLTTTGTNKNHRKPLFKPQSLFKWNSISIAPLQVVLDYQPSTDPGNDLHYPGYAIHMLTMLKIRGALIELPQVEGKQQGSGIWDTAILTWMPSLCSGAQAAQLISSATPIRTLVKVGSGVANLLVLPVNELMTSGMNTSSARHRVQRGLRLGASAFAHSAGVELAGLGATLLEQALAMLYRLTGVEPLMQPTSIPPRLPAPSQALYFRPINQGESEEGSVKQLANVVTTTTSTPALSTSSTSKTRTIVAVPVHSGRSKTITLLPLALLGTALGVGSAALRGLQQTLNNERQTNAIDSRSSLVNSFAVVDLMDDDDQSDGETHKKEDK